MDCIEGIGLIDNESIDLIITSPAYDKMRDYNLDDRIISGKKLFNGDLLLEMKRILKQTGSIIFVIDDQVIKSERTLTVHKLIINAVEMVGLYYHDMYIYLKNYVPGEASRRSRNSFEYMPMFKKDIKNYKYYPDRIKIPAIGGKAGKSRRLKDGKLVSLMNYHHGHPEKDPGNAIYFYTGGKMHENKVAFKHPATFPLELPKFFIKLLTDKNDIILDPFMGSGTTAVACKQLNRNYIGFEISEEYCKIAEERLAEID